MIHSADWLKLNENELAELMPQDRIEYAIRRLQEVYGVKTIVVTRGAQGAALFPTQQPPLHLPVPSGKVTVVDTVGAGDALSAVLIFGIQRGWDNEITLYRAQQFAAGVIGLRGATTKNHHFYQQFLSQWEELF
jgi:fructokinase